MLEKEVIKILKSAKIESDESELEIPPQEFGDIAFPCFELAKIEKRNPQLIAEEIAKKIKLTPLISKVEAKAGYVNFFFNYQKLVEMVLKKILTKKEKFGLSKTGKNKTVVIDFSSPNPVHPIHVGSARNTFIGESLSKILKFSGYDVKRICYVNDLGRQVAKLLYGYLKFSKIKKPNKKPDHWLLDLYVKGNEAIAKNPELEKEIDDILRKLEKKDKKLFPVLKKLVNWCLKGFKQTYSKLGIKFDEYIWESKFAETAKKYVDQLLKKKVAFKTSDNAIVANLEKFNLPNTVLLRYDGTGLYLTRDIAASIYKFKKYKPVLNVYVVAEDQKLHFQQQFKILELLSYKKIVKNSFHLSYAYVTLPEGKISSRIGRVILIDDVFEEAKKEVKRRFKVKDKIAEKIGISAVIYAILKIDPDKQVIFDWDEVLSLQGNNAPYLQYAYTRCSSILKKAKKWKNVFSIETLNEEEKKLVKLLSNFSKVIRQAANDLRPHYVCNYTYELATSFNNFYEKHRVLNAKTEELKNFRLSLVKATQIVLGKCLELMGMYTVEKM